MRASELKYTILSVVASLVILILVLMPFHAFLTVWGSSVIGHYTALRLWKEALLIICGVGVLYLILTDGKIRSHTLGRRLVWLIIIYALINIVWGAIAYARHDVSRKALGYGLIVNLRYLAFFLVAWAVALRTSRLRAGWQGLVIWPAIIVVLFGLLQVFVLPHNVLSHFGYGPPTILPYETINHNAHYVRILSTLRGANPLGAYLVIPISVLSVLIIVRRSWFKIALLAGSLVVLFFSFSRSAWLGAALAVGFIAVLKLHQRFSSRLILPAALLVVILAVAGYSLRHNSRFDNIFLHTQAHSAAKQSSNQGHVAALKAGLHDLIHQPLGQGPGTAGPASVYNNHPSRIAENYYVQIGQETGWLGLVVFLLVNLGVGYLLWLRRDDPLALSLLAAMLGISLINLLSHAWADDTLAYLWWGLAGIAMVKANSKHAAQSR